MSSLLLTSARQGVRGTTAIVAAACLLCLWLGSALTEKRWPSCQPKPQGSGIVYCLLGPSR
eukprot:1761525-Rhodomonas_salina.5